MNGELRGVWHLTWKEIWGPLSRTGGVPLDLFNELVGELTPVPVSPIPPTAPPAEAYNSAGDLVEVHALAELAAYKRAVARYVDDRDEYETAVSGSDARPLFKKTLKVAGAGEKSAIDFLERSHLALGVFDPAIRGAYANLVRDFIVKFNVRYELRPDFSLHPTISGVFANLLSELRVSSTGNNHVLALMDEFEEAFSDLKLSRSETRLKICLQKQFNLLEALGRSCAGVTKNTLGAMCEELDWPHPTIKGVGKTLYGFRSDYPGLGHGGNPDSVIRPIELRDFISITLMLAAFTPYVADQMNIERCYIG